MAGSTAVRLTIPAKPEYITLGRLALTALARVRPFSPETLNDLKVALTEACSNSVRHAYQNGGEGRVEILYELASDRLVVEVADNGSGIEPGDIPARIEDADELIEGGLGLTLIRALADEVEIAERESGGSRLRFVKFLED
ncbi:MAG: ATP-binding protein [Actinomycetota bacterium]|nr:ATP-binding protein [Actinomycetota bacterium]